MKEDGLNRLLAFLFLLSERGIEFKLEQQQPDALMVSFALVGRRVEASFYVDEVEYSVFAGDETVKMGLRELEKLVSG